MNPEKITFIVLALVFTLVSMLIKSRKQKQSSSQVEELLDDFQQESDSYEDPNLELLYLQDHISNLQENPTFIPKTSKKKPHKRILEKEDRSEEIVNNNLQDIDSEIETGLLGDFEGTELQKAFLYSEIFKNAKN